MNEKIHQTQTALDEARLHLREAAHEYILASPHLEEAALAVYCEESAEYRRALLEAVRAYEEEGAE